MKSRLTPRCLDYDIGSHILNQLKTKYGNLPNFSEKDSVYEIDKEKVMVKRGL